MDRREACQVFMEQLVPLVQRIYELHQVAVLGEMEEEVEEQTKLQVPHLLAVVEVVSFPKVNCLSRDRKVAPEPRPVVVGLRFVHGVLR